MAAPHGFSNAAAVLHGINDLRFEDFPLSPKPAESMVRIQINAVGICGSDVHYWKKGRIADFVVDGPMVIGHESAGTVVEVGPGVKRLKVGDRVAVEPGVPCWSNKACREGRYNLCPDIEFFATPPHHGSLMQYVDHPADFCYLLPPNVSFEQGAMVEPLSVGVHACRRGEVRPGKNVAILGAGPIGLVTLMAAKAFGADSVAITDLKNDNLALAEQMGADICLNPKASATPAEVGEWIKASLPPYGPDVVIDCAGFESTLQTGVRACVAGGKVVIVGLGSEEAKIPISVAACKELDISGSFRYCNTYPLCLKLLESGKVDVNPMITHRFGFSAKEVDAAFDTAARAATTGAIKVMFNLEAADEDDDVPE